MSDETTNLPVKEQTHDRVQPVDLQMEMQRSYLDYAMSVIVGRALPDVRDGLKPVHRRVLYAMYDGGYRPTSSFSKSSRVVGEVMGNYHPHGDAAIYDALARLVQPWSLRYPLVDPPSPTRNSRWTRHAGPETCAPCRPAASARSACRAHRAR